MLSLLSLLSALPHLHIRITPVVVNVGPAWVRWHTILLVSGVLAGAWPAVRLAHRHGIDPAHARRGALWIVPAGLVGARLAYLVDHLDRYASHPGQFLAISDGGLAIWGALVGGALAAWAYARRHDLSSWRFADALAYGTILGQAIGRIGNVMSSDTVGLRTGGYWGIEYVDPPTLPAGFEPFQVPTHPYALHEMMWDLAIFGPLFLVARLVKRDGAVFCAYGVLYALGRFLLTFLREGMNPLVDLQQGQLVALLVVVAAAFLAVCRLPGAMRPARLRPEIG